MGPIESWIHAHPFWFAFALTIPWLGAQLTTMIRLSHSRFLHDESDAPPAPAPLVAVIIPARNEAHNIAASVQAVLASHYPALEVIVVDDHSTDDTARIARDAANDSRLQLLANPDLPPGWFGKQWACQNGANIATGEILLFLDADTIIAPDAIPRAVNGMSRTNAALYSVVSRQEMHSFWERLIQPQIFTTLASRYGGTESVNQSRNAVDKIANGQFLMIRRADYVALNGHESVREYVAEDLMLAQKYFRAEKKTVVVASRDEVATRMYTSLPELINGWRKNVYAGGRHAVPGGAIGQFFFPVMLLASPLFQLAPVGILIVALAGLLSTPWLLWSGVTTLSWLCWWMIVYRLNKIPLHYTFYFPIGATLMGYIFTTAIIRGYQVQWKGRAYETARP